MCLSLVVYSDDVHLVGEWVGRRTYFHTRALALFNKTKAAGQRKSLAYKFVAVVASCGSFLQSLYFSTVSLLLLFYSDNKTVKSAHMAL